jgi:hypothetical protein
MTRRIFSGLIFFALCAAMVATGEGVLGAQPTGDSTASAPTPIKHVVVIFQENHSFDNVLGPLCVNVLHGRCDGATMGFLHDGTPQPLNPATDLVPQVDHSVAAQLNAIKNGFETINGCQAPTYNCFTAFVPPQPGTAGFIPNLATLAENYVISDKTFELSPEPSWGSHLSFVAAQLDGFTGDNPVKGTNGTGPGWGCDSKKDAAWRMTPTSPITMVPSCVPTPQGAGPYKPSPVKFIPNVFGRLLGKGLNFKLYTDNSTQSGYIWSICPTFAECLLTGQAQSMVPTKQILTDTATGGPGLPSFSVVLPNGVDASGHAVGTSQHNGNLMSVGDNWIGEVVSAIQGSKDWASTAIFITYDDCGCFYDHAAIPNGFGIRVPMVIVSPFAKSAFTDSNVASFASMLRFTERVFSLKPLAAADANAYDYFGSFNFTAPPNLTKSHLIQQPVSPALLQQVQATKEDPNDPT